MISNVPLLSGRHWAFVFFLALFSFTAQSKQSFNHTVNFERSTDSFEAVDHLYMVPNANQILQCEIPGSELKVFVAFDHEKSNYELLDEGGQTAAFFSPDCHGNCTAESDPFCDDEDVIVNWTADGYYNNNYMLLKDDGGSILQTVNLPNNTSGSVNFGTLPPGAYTAELYLNNEGLKDVCSFDVTDCGFEFDCDDGVRVDTYGAGNGSCVSDPDIRVQIPDPGNVFEVTIEVVYKSQYPGSSIQISDNNGTTYTVPQVYQSNWSSWVYRITLPGSYSYFDHNKETSNCGSSGVQSMVVYAFRNVSEPIAQVGIFSENSGYNNVRYIDLAIPTDTDPRDVKVTLPISELTNDGRYMKITATSEINGSDDQVATTYICGPDVSLNNCCLDFVEIDIPNVSPNANNLEIEVDTRNGYHSTSETGCSSTSGQSWIMAGIVIVDLECESFTDYGDAPESYGEICVDIDSGSPAFLGTIGDHDEGMQYSAQANGDDNDGNDDEDGVTFVGGNTLTGGTTEQITITWETEDHDSYISGWIDFNRDGDFDTNEKVIDDYEVGSCCGTSTGSHTFDINVPSTAKCGVSYARFLIVSDEDDGPTGLLCGDPTGNDGEVEDYKVNIDGNLMVMMPPTGEICEGDEIVLTVSATGGSGDYTFNWSDGLGTGMSKTVSPNSTKTYYVTVTDDVTGCEDNDEVTVNVYPNPDVDAGQDQSYCLDDGNNSVTLTAVGTGGTGTLSYSWSNGQNGASITVSPNVTTTYTVTVMDEKFCMATDQVKVFVHPNPIVDAGPDQGYCLDDGTNFVTLSAQGTGGTGNLSYSWSTGQNGASIIVSPDVTTTYTVTVEDENGCTGTDDVTVYVYENPVVDLGPDDAICYGESYTLIAAVSGGTPDYDFEWDPDLGNSNTNTVSPTQTTTYSVTVTDAKGCKDTDEFTIYVNPNPEVDLGVDVTICEEDSYTLTASVTGGTPDYDYEWDPFLGNSNSHTVTPTQTTTYSVTVTDSEGCEDTDQITVFVEPCPSCCDYIDKPAFITLQYTGEDCAATVTEQDPDKYDCSGDPNFDPEVFIIANDDDDPTKGNIWFEGSVSLNDYFSIDAALAGEDKLDSKTFVHIFASEGGALLQFIEFHTSCSQPINLNDQYGSIKIVYVLDDDGLECGDFLCEIDPGEIAEDEANCGPFDPELIYSVVDASVEYVPAASEEDCCVDGFKPAVLTMKYTGQSCSSTQTTQPDDKWNCDGDPNYDSQVYIIANDKDDHTDGYIWFSGTVGIDETFEIDAANDGENRLKANTVIHIFDHQGGTLLQKVNFHTSCSQPLGIGDQWGANKLLHIVAENGETCEDQTCDLQYSWEYKSATTGDWTLIPGANSNEYDPPYITETTQYRRIASHCVCGEVISNIVTKTVYPDPIVDAGEDQAYCLDDGSNAVTLFASVTGGTPQYTFNWNKGLGQGQSHTVSPDETTLYRVTVTDHNGCQDVDEVLVTVYENPDVNLGLDKTICLSQSTTLTANVTGGTAPYSFEWDPDLGDGSSYTVSPTQTTTYKVTVTDFNGCTDVDEVIVYVEPCDEIDHYKILTNIEQTAPRKFMVEYDIIVENNGQSPGMYDLEDEEGFDDDIDIQSVNFTSDVPGNPGSNLSTSGPWTLANDQAIGIGEIHSYTMRFFIELDLLRPVPLGDGLYTKCEDATPGDPDFGEGLYNQSKLDTDNDGQWDQYDEACGDLPFVSHEKNLGQIIQTGARSWTVSYTLIVRNEAGASGVYTLYDDPGFDDDIQIVSASYTSNAPGNPGGPLVGDGPWNLAVNHTIAPWAIHDYELTFNVVMDLNDPNNPGDGVYDECEKTEPGDPRPGEGLYNLSALDVNEDGQFDEEDEACGDLPFITHEKILDEIVQTGPTTWEVYYDVNVINQGGAPGQYDLWDEPGFDDDIRILEVELSRIWNCPTGAASAEIVTHSGPYQLANNRTLGPGMQDCHSLKFTVQMDLNDPVTPGDGLYTACESYEPGDPDFGEGLYNQSKLDVNDDGTFDEYDEACGDLPSLRHEKQLVSVTQTAKYTYEVVYDIVVTNDGGTTGTYNLEDEPGFDNDVTITGALYSSDAPGNPGTGLGVNNPGPYTLASGQSIAQGAVHTYTLTIYALFYLDGSTPGGDGVYNECESTTPGDPQAGEGLYNQSKLDVDDDGQWDEYSEDCGDLPFVTHEKTVYDIVQTGGTTWDVIYQIQVRNLGGATGHYTLRDAPGFDDDITILGADFTSNAPGIPGGTLTGAGPWTLATNEDITAGAVHTYTLTVSVRMDLTDPNTPGDGYYDECEKGIPGEPQSGEGLYNKSSLDVNLDGEFDEFSIVCDDIPSITHQKTLVEIEQLGPRTWEVTYDILVENQGGIQGAYDLWDEPGFDDDIVILEAYHEVIYDCPNDAIVPTTLSGNYPWQLEDNRILNPGKKDCHTLRFIVQLDLFTSPAVGDGVYTACETQIPGNPDFGEGLYNQSKLDVNDDGVFDEYDEACGDIPDIHHQKELSEINQNPDGSFTVVYTVAVTNYGGASGEYNLWDKPEFEDDFDLISASFLSSIPSGTILPTVIPAQGWQLASDQSLAAGATHVFVLTLTVELDLDDPNSGGDEYYEACASNQSQQPQPGEGLFNQSYLDVDDDGQFDETSKACGDVPNIYHEKELISIVQTGPRAYTVVYQIYVDNNGGEVGYYDLEDEPGFDDDVVIAAADYITDAPDNYRSILVGNGPWKLADDQSIAVGVTHTYTLTFEVELDLLSPLTPGDGVYKECASGFPGDPTFGEGLYNQSKLDDNNDGVWDEYKEACGDLPDIHHEKTLADIIENTDGTFTVVYEVVVTNLGGAAGDYNLWDRPDFDDDIEILSASYSSDVPSGDVLPPIVPFYGWLIGYQISLNGGSTHTYVVTIDVDLDLIDPASPGDEIYKACESTEPGNPVHGEGLFNQSFLDVDDDGYYDETDKACGDLPSLHHEKQLLSVTQTAPYVYEVIYEVVVTNDGGTAGTYNLEDAPAFDNDVTILGASYSSDAPGNPGEGLGVNNPGPYALATGQSIGEGDVHTYTISIFVLFYLDGNTPGGDGVYTACESATPGDPKPHEGLYNQSKLDVNDDGIWDEYDEDCGDLPFVTHVKQLDNVVQTGPGTYDVIYHIIVQNLGGAQGHYDLFDDPDFDDDILIQSASYTSSAPGVPGGVLIGTGVWTLGNDVLIAAGAIHDYIVTVKVQMDLLDPNTPGDGIYTSCESNEPGDPVPGEGLYNASFLDLNDDGNYEEEDEACGDLPSLHHEKTLVDIQQTGPRDYLVTYEIIVVNDGGTVGTYDLQDEPGFDDDIFIGSMNYTSDAPGNPGSNLNTSGVLVLADDQPIAAGVTHTYTLRAFITLDLTLVPAIGDGVYSSCESSVPGNPTFGEGLYNQSKLDIDNDGYWDEYDEACGDIPDIHHLKKISQVTVNPGGTYTVVYSIDVYNLGGATGEYRLTDVPQFDDDIVILSASYTSDVPSGDILPATVPAGGWVLGDDVALAPGGLHVYTITAIVDLDLLDPGSVGDEVYHACESATPGDPKPGEGLYNASYLDVDGDDTPDEQDETCGDIPNLHHDKTISSIEHIDGNRFRVMYAIEVVNNGGITGYYNLQDEPAFDDDVVIQSASYTTDITGLPGGNLPGNGPWNLATDQEIGVGEVQTFTLEIIVKMDLSDPNTPGDGEYTNCESSYVDDPVEGEGLYNQSRLDVNDDGQWDEYDEACGDIPDIHHEKTFEGVVEHPDGTFTVTYYIDVTNYGGVVGSYNLNDAPAFDDDIVIISASYSSDVPSGSALTAMVPANGWVLGSDIELLPGESHHYVLEVVIAIDLLDPASPGDEIYRPCEYSNQGYPVEGEGLFNNSLLDVNDDGEWDEEDIACGDLPSITHSKTVHTAPVELPNGNFEVKYQIEVFNLGGAAGIYSLTDMPEFDDDVEIVSVSYTSTNGGQTGNPVDPGVLPWVLATGHSIGAYPAAHTYVLTVEVSIDLTDGVGDDTYDYCYEASPEGEAGRGLFNRSLLFNSNEDIIEKDSTCIDVVLGSIGDFVFYDRDQDGFQDADDPGFYVPDLEVHLLDGSQNVLETTTVDVNGYYEFTNLSAGNYYVKFELPDNYAFTTKNNPADDAKDSDADETDGLSGLIVLGSGEHNPTIDAGLIATIDYEEFCLCLDNASQKGDGQFNEKIAIYGYPGEVWTITQRSGMFKRQPDSPNPPGQPVPIPLGSEFDNDPAGSGLYSFEFMHIDKEGYTVTVSNEQGATLQISNVCAYPEVEYYSYQEVICTTDPAFDLFGFATVPGDVKFYYEGQEYTEINPLEFGIGEFIFEMIVIPDDPEECIAREYTLAFKIEECEELVTHYKELVSVERVGDNFKATYNVVVENIGLDVSDYDLFDAPGFDDDIQLLQASYSSDSPGNPGGTLNGNGPWQLADDQAILPGNTHTYTIEIYLRLNLLSPYTPGDGIYSECNSSEVEFPVAGEGLFNESRLDLDDDGNWEETSVDCGDIPDIHHQKTLTNITNNPNGTYEIEYLIEVENYGGAVGIYNLKDKPQFDDDVEILSASYNSTVPSGGVLSPTVPASGWVLANDESIAPGEVHSYYLTILVELDLVDPASPGDEIYEPCSSSQPGGPVAGQGLYNQSLLDWNEDGQFDEDDDACGDLEVIDLALTIEADTRGPFLIGQNATFTIKVYNQSNVPVENVEIADYFTYGYNWNGGLNPGWSYNGAFASYTVPGVIMPGAHATVSLTLEVASRQNYELDDWVTYAEIVNIFGLDGANKNGQEIDSTPGSDTAYERSVKPDDPWDNVITGSGPPNEDEDDHDPAKVEVVLAGSIGDKVWMDTDGDGKQDPGEPGVEGVRVKLYTCQNQLVAEQFTNSAGIYRFEDIFPGSYYVQFDITTLPPNTSWTTPNVGGNDNLDSDAGFDGKTICTTIEGGEVDNSWDAGLIELANVGDFVWEDTNGDGIQNIGEFGIPNVLVKLYRANGTLVGQQYTDNTGHYLFTGVFPGHYYLKFVKPSNYSDVTFPGILDDSFDSDVDDTNGVNTTATFHLSSGETDLKWDAGYYKCADIGSLVWCDYELNDIWDDDENGINGLKVVLYKYNYGNWTEWDYVYTGHKPGTPSDDGYWNLCVPPGTYYAEFRMPIQAGMVIAEPNVGTDENRDSDITGAFGYGTTDAFSVISGDELMDIGAGYSYGATLAGRVWYDTQKDGQYVVGEPLAPNVWVEAFNELGDVVGDDVTDNEGNYEIIGLRGEEIYYVRFYQPLSYGFTISNTGDDATDSDVDEWNGPGTTAFYGLQQNEDKYLDAGLVQSVLPIEMEAFWGEVRSGFNLLEWTTLHETNSDKYIIERRLDSDDVFRPIGEVNAKGHSNDRSRYAFRDYDVKQTGFYYYRLRLIDLDGNVSYSETVVLLLEKQLDKDVAIFPNPCINEFNVDLQMDQEDQVRIDILDAKGRLVLDGVFDETVGNGIQSLNITTEALTNGMYNVRVVKGNKVFNKKLIVLK